MAFKADESFLKYLSIGAVGVQRIMEDLRDKGFEPIELERYCASNKIWTTKVKRLRLPDLLCAKTGMRVEARAKTDLKIRMSDAPSNPDRVWDAGLRNNDIVAVIACSDTGEGLHPANRVNYLTVRAMRESVDQSKLGPPKSASEGAERDRTWARNGTNQRRYRVGSHSRQTQGPNAQGPRATGTETDVCAEGEDCLRWPR